MSVIDIDWKPDNRKLRQFAIVWLVGFTVFGAVAAWRVAAGSGTGSWTLPAVLWSLAAAVGVAGLARPGLVRPVYLAWMGLAFPIGWLVSHLFLGVLFYGIFTPVGILFRTIGRDPLNLRPDPARESYWIERRASSSARRYFNQF